MRKIIIFITSFILLNGGIIANQKNEVISSKDELLFIDKVEQDKTLNKNSSNSINFMISQLSLIVISFYQDYLGKIKGSYCPMYPSCSAYGSEIIQKYGYKGIMMTFDRLNRCSHDLNNYPVLVIDKEIRYYDPPSIY